MGIERCPTCGGPVEASVEGGHVVFRSSAGPVRLTEAIRLTEADTKTEGGQSFSASAYAYVPDAAKPSGWKLRLEEEPGKGPTAKQVGMALAALSPGGFRGKKVAIPTDALPTVKRKIFAAWKKVHEPDDAVPDVLKSVEAVGDRTFDDIRTLVEEAIVDSYQSAGADEVPYIWVQDLTDTWAVYRAPDADLYQVTYTLDDAGNITLGEPQPVQKVTSYEPDADDADGNGTEARKDRIHGRVVEAKGTDDDGGRVYGVQVIAYGDSRNGRRYPEAVMRAATPKYEGAKAYDHHRSEEELQSSTIVGLVGSFRNVKAGSGGLEADLHLLPSATHAAEALDASLAAEEEGLPPLVGLSHDVMAKYTPLVEGGKRLMEATEICSVNSADVVADPAAGGKATRMVAGGTGDNDPEEGTTMTLKELLAALRDASAEKRAELLTEHKTLLDEYGLDDAAVGRLLDPPAGDGGGTGTGDNGGEGTATGSGDGNGTEVTAGAGATESRIVRSSVTGRMLIREAVSGVGLADRFVETITKRLPEQFTETELVHQVEGYRDMAAELEQQGLVSDPRIIPGGVKVTREALDAKVKKLENLLDEGYRGAEAYRSLKQAFVDITGHNPYASDTEDFNRLILRESIGTETYDSAARRGVESATTSTWNLVLGDSITRRMVADYDQPDLQNWRPLVSSTPPINDFRTQRIERIGGYGVLPIVNQGAPYQPLTTPGNEEATYVIAKRGGTEDLTLEMIANDDLRAVQRIPKRLGLAAAQTLYRFVWDMFITNPTYTPDSTALFAAGHNNTVTTGLSNSNLNAARRALRKQSAYGDTTDVLSLVPKFLVTVPDLEHLAYQLCTSAVALPTSAPDGGAANQPNLHQGLEPIIIDYWSASSATAWFLVADPNRVPTIEVGFYQGRQDPELFVQSDPTTGSVFSADKLTYKIRHIYSGTALDFRGLYRGNS